MQDFGLGDLAWILVALAVAVFLMSGGPQAIGRAFMRRYYPYGFMSRAAELVTDDERAELLGESLATTTPQNDNNGIAITATEHNALLFAAKADALAALVHAGKVGETEGIKLVFGVGPSSSSKTYQAARELLKARLARLQPERFKLTPEQEQFRERLGLSNHSN